MVFCVAVGTVLYERRFGGLSDHRDVEMERFIKAVADMFQLTAQLFLIPMWLVKYLQREKYKRQLEDWDILFKTGTYFLTVKQMYPSSRLSSTPWCVAWI